MVANDAGELLGELLWYRKSSIYKWIDMEILCTF